MLMPKKVKYRKQQRGRRTGKAWRGGSLAFGEYGLKALEAAWITDRQIEAARVEAQKIIVEGRQTGEKLRATMVEETHQQQQQMLERARREIEQEKERAIAEMRREAIELAIAGASKVIEKNLDDQSNRKIVESFLASIPAREVKRG